MNILIFILQNMINMQKNNTVYEYAFVPVTGGSEGDYYYCFSI